MAKKYLYKNISLYQSMGRWSADYVYPNEGRGFGLHVACTTTKEEAYRIAKREIDFLNERAKTNA